MKTAMATAKSATDRTTPLEQPADERKSSADLFGGDCDPEQREKVEREVEVPNGRAEDGQSRPQTERVLQEIEREPADGSRRLAVTFDVRCVAPFEVRRNSRPRGLAGIRVEPVPRE